MPTQYLRVKVDCETELEEEAEYRMRKSGDHLICRATGQLFQCATYKCSVGLLEVLRLEVEKLPSTELAEGDLLGEFIAASRALFDADHYDHFEARMSDSELEAIDRLRDLLSRLPEPKGGESC